MKDKIKCHYCKKKPYITSKEDKLLEKEILVRYAKPIQLLTETRKKMKLNLYSIKN